MGEWPWVPCWWIRPICWWLEHDFSILGYDRETGRLVAHICGRCGARKFTVSSVS
jgi:hypothetical protein